MQISVATLSDLDDIIAMIKELAEYENMSDCVEFNKEDYEKSLFGKKYAHALIAKEDDLAVGYAIYFYNFSTFVGRGGIYLEDLYVRPKYRKKGIGTAFFKYLAKICIDENLGRLEWVCLDWNAPSLDFYAKLGAQKLPAWQLHRLDKNSLKSLASGDGVCQS